MSSSICNICKENPWKYKCPQCGRRTCSLECSKKHKLQFDCQGKIQVTAFVDRKTLTSTPHALNRDYAFLQKINRRLELTSQDDESHMVTGSSFGKRKRNHSQTKIVKNGVNIACLPAGMQRAKRNKSGWNPKRKKFIWTVEYKDFTKPDQPLATKDVTDDTLIKTVLNLPIESTVKVWLHFRTQGSVKYVVEVDSNKELNSQLLGKTVVEYPTFIITETSDLPSGYEEYREDTSDSSSSEEDTSESDDSDSEGPEEVPTKQAGPSEMLSEDQNGVAEKHIENTEVTQSLPTFSIKQDDISEELSSKQIGNPDVVVIKQPDTTDYLQEIRENSSAKYGEALKESKAETEM